MSTIIQTNPYTMEEIERHSYDSFKTLNEKINDAKKAQKKWQEKSIAERKSILLHALSYFKENEAPICRRISDEMGKPIHQSHNEMRSFFERADHLLAIAEDSLKSEVIENQGNILRQIDHAPLGTVLIISAWNYPLIISLNGVFAALLAGNAVLLKHSIHTLSVGFYFAEAFGRMKEAPDILQNLIAEHQDIENIIKEKHIDHIVFTGSTRGGQELSEIAGKAMTSLHLELGGKDAAYVAADADPELAAASLVEGAMYNAGQSCCGIERVYVHQKNYDAFITECLDCIDEYQLGDPLAPETTMGPLVHSSAAEIMEQHVQGALDKGARLLCGGHRQMIMKGCFFQPTLIVDVDHSMEIMQEENFGPILAIMPVENDNQAIELINDCRYGLSAALYSHDKTLSSKFAQKVEAGTIFRNRCDYLDPALPWTGWKDSGHGSALSKYGFYGMTKRKSINFR